MILLETTKKLQMNGRIVGYRFESIEGLYLDLGVAEVEKLFREYDMVIYQAGLHKIMLSMHYDNLDFEELHEVVRDGKTAYMTSDEIQYSDEDFNGYWYWTFIYGSCELSCISRANKHTMLAKRKTCSEINVRYKNSRKIMGYTVIEVDDCVSDFRSGSVSFKFRLDTNASEYEAITFIADTLSDSLSERFGNDIAVTAGEKGYFTLTI